MKWRYGAGSGLRSGIGGNGVIPSSLSVFPVSYLSLLCFICQGGQRVTGGELRHLASSPGGGGGYQGAVILELQRIQYD